MDSANSSMMGCPNIMTQIQKWDEMFRDKYITISISGEEECLLCRSVHLNNSMAPPSIDFMGDKNRINCKIGNIYGYNINLNDYIKVKIFKEDEMDVWRILSVK